MQLNNILLKILALLFFVLIVLTVNSQNLVPNHSFEEYDNCEIGAYMGVLSNWFLPEGGGSADYFNSCSELVFPNTSTPSNIFGYEYANTGEGYCGFGTYQDETFTSREFLRVELIAPLQFSQEYCISLWLSLADSSSYTSDLVQCYFSAENLPLGFKSDTSLVDISQVSFYGTDTIDFDGWVQFSSSFIAEGGERYLTIGNFQSHENIDTTFLFYNQYPYYAYFYIDDVDVQLCENSISEKTILTQVFPNPFQTDLLIENADSELVEYYLYSTEGILLDSDQLEGTSIKLNLSNYSIGTYLLTIFDERGKSFHRIVKTE
jgi:OOP family OmpA-OmpF porin